MAERDASVVQLDFPELTADIIAALRLTGTLGLFNMSDTVIPIISVGNVRPQTVVLEPTTFSSADILSGLARDPGGNAVIGDTGALPAGTYDIWAHISRSSAINVGLSGPISLEHRNAANDDDLAVLLACSVGSGNQLDQFSHLPLMGYTIGLNERFRFTSSSGSQIGFVATTLGFRIRPTP